ncbi:cytochrome P450 [Nocardia huaxiensis]|uniref:Cytochrome P450 n=1 Tax=Nocardia huaxiensis TaxID=2755382 RepID=A0A7D6ZHS1_9NOCA|nr:cytochrome P450 [Nocardia huaxiensis]QLY28283.1 cytochrome P450 [Nocardia huaxiensis]UFS98282.1 cytochrome P450 [Nocardia huaxiensis]
MTVEANTSGGVAVLNVLDPAFRPDSPEVIAARAANWYARTPIGFAILRHRQAVDFLADRRFRWGGVESLAAQGITGGPAVEWIGSVLPSIEGADHARLRRLVSRAFTRAAVDRLRPVMRAVAEELAEPLARAGECEFMSAFADRYPARILAELLGIPPEQRENFRRLPQEIGLIFTVSAAAHLDRIETAIHTLNDGIDALLEQRRRTPGDDLLTELLAAEDAGDRLSPVELRNMVSALLFAGQDTTRQQLGLAVQLFADHLGQWRMLAADPALAPRAVEEIMRVAPGVNTIWRVCDETVDFEDLTIPAGSFVNILSNAAHTDPAAFGEAEFDITAARSAAQLTFGGGIHYCLGAPLARAEIAEALPILARTLPHPVAAGPALPGPTLGPTGPLTLPLRFLAP